MYRCNYGFSALHKLDYGPLQKHQFLADSPPVEPVGTCKKCNCTEQILESCLPRMPAYVDFPKHFHTLAAKAILWPYSCGLQHICSETWRWKGEEGSAKLNVEIWIWTLVALNQFLPLLGSSFCSQACNFPMCPFNDYVFRSKTFQFKSLGAVVVHPSW